MITMTTGEFNVTTDAMQLKISMKQEMQLLPFTSSHTFQPFLLDGSTVKCMESK